METTDVGRTGYGDEKEEERCAIGGDLYHVRERETRGREQCVCVCRGGCVGGGGVCEIKMR